jgi:uncharacterized protein (DUF1330 family)
MTAYVIASVTVTDAEKYKNYMALSPTAVAAAGGKFIVRGGNMKVLEGAWANPRVVIIQYATREAAEAFYDSALYVAARAERAGAAQFNMIVVDGV